MLLARMAIRKPSPINNRDLFPLCRNLGFLISPHRLLRHNFPVNPLTSPTATRSLRVHTAETGAR